jgi:hypothetical protein
VLEALLNFLMTGEGMGLTGLMTVGIVACIIAVRQSWQTQSIKMSAEDPQVLSLRRPSWLVERMDAKNMDEPLDGAVERAGAALKQGGEASRAAAFGLHELRALGGRATSMIRQTAFDALADGEVRSTLVRLPSAVAHIVCIPGRFEHSKLFERLEPFSSGWLAYAERLRAVTAANGSPGGLLALLFFFDPDVRNGVLLVAYESSGLHLVPKDLVGETGRLAATGEASGPFDLNLRTA